MKTRILHSITFLLLIGLLLGACAKQVTPTITVTEPPQTPEPTFATATEAVPPTETAPVPEDLQAEVIFWAPQGSNETLVQEIDTKLAAYASHNELAYVKVEQLSSVQLGSAARVVVSLASAEETGALARSAGGVAFLSVDGTEELDLANLHAISAKTSTPDQAAFLAGYALGLVTPEYRVGVISQAGTALGQQVSGGFVTGARFYCGLCRSRFAPVMYYPLTAEVNDPTSPADWRAAADSLLSNAVAGIYVQPEVSSPELIAYLASKGVNLIGAVGQNGLETQANWVGVLSSSIGDEIVAAVQGLLNGNGTAAVNQGVSLTNINEELMSAGKQILFERIRQQMLEGLIKTLP